MEKEKQMDLLTSTITSEINRRKMKIDSHLYMLVYYLTVYFPHVLNVFKENSKSMDAKFLVL